LRSTVLIFILLFVFIPKTHNEEIGQASWYSLNDPTDPWPHTTTASGEPFDENSLTCALRSRDFGGYYQVTNPANYKSVIVKHTDFGPAFKYKGRKLNRKIDLSKAAFAKIADLNTGIIKVSIEKIGRLK